MKVCGGKDRMLATISAALQEADISTPEQVLLMIKIVDAAIDQVDEPPTYNDYGATIDNVSAAILKLVSQSGKYVYWPLDDISLFKMAVNKGVTIAVLRHWWNSRPTRDE